MIEAAYQCPMVKGLAIKAAFGLDHGKLYGNTAGGMLTVSFNGPIKIRR